MSKLEPIIEILKKEKTDVTRAVYKDKCLMKEKSDHRFDLFECFYQSYEKMSS